MFPSIILVAIDVVVVFAGEKDVAMTISLQLYRDIR